MRLPFRHTGNSRCYSTYEFSRSLNLTLCQFLRWFTPVEPNQATFVSPALDKLMSAICTAKQRIREQAITASAQLDSLQLGAHSRVAGTRAQRRHSAGLARRMARAVPTVR